MSRQGNLVPRQAHCGGGKASDVHKVPQHEDMSIPAVMTLERVSKAAVGQKHASRERATMIAVSIADQMSQNAETVESEVTERMEAIVAELGGEAGGVVLKGLEQKLKSLESLKRKIALVVRRWQMTALSDVTTATDHTKLREHVNEQIVDALRYTLILPHET